MMIESIQIQGFTSIREQMLQLGKLNILIGANGAGKSNIIRVFTLLQAMMAGNLQVAVRKSGGAEALLSQRSDSHRTISFFVRGYGQEYRCTLVPGTGNTLLIGDEIFCSSEDLKRDYAARHVPEEIKPGSESRYAMGGDTYISNSELSPLATALTNIRTYQMAELHRLDSPPLCNDWNVLITPDARNLACVIADLYRRHPQHYQYIRDTIRLAVPFFDDFNITGSSKEQENTQTLGWREHHTEYIFPMQDLSDGIRRFIVLCTLLNSPVLPSLIIINEPEAGLHPYAIAILAAQVQSASTRTQLIVATQSVTFINQCTPDDLLIVGRHAGETVVNRIDTDEIQDWLKDYTLGELWEHNVIGGRPDR